MGTSWITRNASARGPSRSLRVRRTTPRPTKGRVKRRIEADRLGEIRDRFVKLSEILVERGKRQEADHGCRIELDGRRQVGECFVVLVQCIQSDAATDLGQNKFRIDPYHFGKIGDGLARLSLSLVEGLATQNADDRVVRLNRDGLAIFRNGLISEAAIAIGDASRRMRVEKVVSIIGGRFNELSASHFNRGFGIRNETIRRWVLEFVPVIARNLRR